MPSPHLYRNSFSTSAKDGNVSNVTHTYFKNSNQILMSIGINFNFSWNNIIILMLKPSNCYGNADSFVPYSLTNYNKRRYMSPGSSPGIMYSDIQRCDIYYYSAYKLETIFSTNSMHIETNDARTAQGKEYSCSHVDGMNSHVMYVTKVMIKQGSTPSSSRGGDQMK